MADSGTTLSAAPDKKVPPQPPSPHLELEEQVPHPVPVKLHMLVSFSKLVRKYLFNILVIDFSYFWLGY